MLRHTKVRLLSRSRVPNGLVNLSKEVVEYWRVAVHKVAEKFEDEKFLQTLCHLADIF